jgi:hypothetical protein
MTDIDKLLHGSIDMHLHHSPDLTPRRVDALEAARQAQHVGMRAIVLKNHYYPTTPMAILVKQLVPGIDVFGSICLNLELGGLNFYALEASAKLGAKVVWMPTLSSANARAKTRKLLKFPLEGDGFSIVNTEGKLVPEVDRILSLVKKYDMVLASGHMSPVETFTLFDEAQHRGIRRLVVTHPADIEISEQPFNSEDLHQLARMGACIECTLLGLLPTMAGHNPLHMVEIIKSIGAEHCIMSTDLGQLSNPVPSEGMRMFMAILFNKGVTEQEIEIMAKVNPARLLDLD